MKNLLQAIAQTNDKDSLADSAAKLNKLWLMEQLPVLQWVIMPLGDGEFEIIRANRMRIPTRVSFNAFAGPYTFKVTKGDEISTRFAIFDGRTGERARRAAPTGHEIELDSEL